MPGRSLTAIISCCVLIGCASSEPKSHEGERIPELEALLNQNIVSLDEELERSKEGGRLWAIEQVGVAAGIHQGRRWRQGQINGWLEQMNQKLASTFNFEQLLIDGVYLPPRVEEVRGHVEQTPNGDLRIIRQAYRIASEPQLVPSPPTYLNYLYQIPDPAEPINPLGLPQAGSEEIQVWHEAVTEGWQIGVHQADIEFKTDLNLLRRDFGGMLRYIDLVAKGLIAMPSISREDFGVMISADGRQLNLGDEILTIERDPTFQHYELWETLEDGLQ